MIAPSKGKILISEPFLPDPNFHRSVVLLVEHDENGSLGYVLNQPTGLVCQDLFKDFECQETVFLGGPVGHDYFHMLHNVAELEDCVEIMPGLYRGGDFDVIKSLYNQHVENYRRFRFFAGYSGWGVGQLEEEIKQKSWIVVEGDINAVFSDNPNLWKVLLSTRGKELAWLSNAPDDVSLN